MKSLIVYYSYEGNCKEIAKTIQKVTNSDILCIEPKKEKKTKSLFRFVWGGMQVYMTKKPELLPYNINLEQYDTIFIGSPVWFGSYAPPINTFLSENEIKGKKIGIFICSGNNKRNTFNNFEEVLKENDIIGEIEFVYPIKNGIESANRKAIKWAKECRSKVDNG